MDSDEPKPEAILEKIRPICLSLPDTRERLSWGHPTFTVHDRPFAVFEKYHLEWCLCFRTELEHQGLFVKDPRFFITPYIGKQGWLSLRVHAAKLNWTEIRQLLRDSHKLVSALPAVKRRRPASS